MLMPKRTKFRKQHRGKIRGNATRGHEIAFGEYGLQAMEPGWLPARDHMLFVLRGPGSA